ncbi:HAS-barrel domain-containing protein [Rhodothermus profundi]|uniref:HAS barrel domain-containing protein n=1 Tax=Rhodothermus profundi TaxID=633813 RepID=A0A1M6PVC7_9BACT|nr:HAS-barrel domain-containing protein [Rhodothermus profundi]SHK11905.1 HAS barrel domain-containing protein [Rhodothermus profundi]
MPIGEVIESSTRQFVAEVYREQAPPALGSWVQVRQPDGQTVYGLVSHVEIGSVEPGRRPVALGRSPDELRREMPHVLELIRTTFRAQVLAYEEPGGPIRQTLPPYPASIHAFVEVCPPDIVQRLGPPYDFLRTLVQNPDPAVPVDDLLVAVLRQIYNGHRDAEREQALIAAGRVLSRLLRDDHERLQAILRRVV